MTIAILSAMAEENDTLLPHMRDVQSSQIGRRTYHQGALFGTPVVVVFSHWGKVAAASTAAVLISHFKVDEIIFTGVAGAIDATLNVGDVVVGSDLYQHDMDARPLIERHEIPLLGMTAMPSDLKRRAQLADAAQRFISVELPTVLAQDVVDSFRLHAPKVVTAAIASGDQFISSQESVDDLRARLSDVACVEMEGGSVAQVCTEFGVPFSVVRTISDAADEAAPIDFPRFIKDVARQYSLGIIKNLIS